ncbi:crossover junction endodeoxyribonuclease RuvC [candidate division WOR-3 bacterium]|nr:crossover junction endodeoxyribonuclease RuvC [candidate division WOR-3 bacterium]
MSATGYGIVEDSRVIDYGVVKTDAGTPVAERLRLLGNELERLVRRHRPERCAIESLFFKGGGARSVILSAQCRGVILYVMARKDIPVAEVTPATIKLAMTGSGRASKQQVNFMVRRLLGLDDRVPEHAADALAAAWCLARRLPRPVTAR